MLNSPTDFDRAYYQRYYERTKTRVIDRAHVARLCGFVCSYLDDRAARKAITNLSKLCRGALYLESMTEEDWRRGVVDRRYTDSTMHRRPAEFYRRALDRHFIGLGGGVWLPKQVRVPIFHLDRV